MSLGVPLNAGDGSLIVSGTLSPESAAEAVRVIMAPARTRPKVSEHAAVEPRERVRDIFIIEQCIV
jgi:hypothetical protein